MDSVAAVKLFHRIQQAFQVIAALQLTAYLWPETAIVQDGAIFDFIVVGSGTAGSVVAARLAEDQKTRVLLIEAGGNPPIESVIPSLLIYLEKSSVDWNYVSEDDGYTQRCHYRPEVDLMLGKMVGGTSSMNFVLFAEGHYRDYDNWAKIAGDDTWSWNNIFPYFVKAFKADATKLNISSEFHYTNDGNLGLLKDTRVDFDNAYLNAFEEAGHEIVPFLNANKTMGYTTSMYTIDDGIRQSTAYSHLRPVKDFTNLYVLKETVAKKILFDDDKNAIGVEIVTADGKVMTVKSSKEVIVSAGAINSPKLLMLSGIGPKEHLHSKNINVLSDLPVGQNFQDHVVTIVIHNITKLNGLTKSRDSRDYPAHVVTGYGNLDKTKDYPEYATVSYVNYARYLIQFCRITYGLNDKICDAMFASSNTNPMLFTVVTNIRPKSRGEVLLRSADYNDSPIVRTGYHSEKEDLENQAKFIEDFLRIENTPSFKDIGGELVDPKLDGCVEHEFRSTDYWRCFALCMMTTRRHYAATNAMGSVVDSRLRVKGVNKLRVVDASVMPVITSGDTNGPTVVIGEKAADMIKEDNNIELIN